MQYRTVSETILGITQDVGNRKETIAAKFPRLENDGCRNENRNSLATGEIARKKHTYSSCNNALKIEDTALHNRFAM